MKRLFYIVVLLLLPLAASSHAGTVTGAVELGYARWEQSMADGDSDWRSGFAQRYSVLYKTSGALYRGNLGRYDLRFGGESVALDYNQPGGGYSLRSTKFLYRGEVLVAPGRLPFRIHLFRYDEHDTGLDQNNELLFAVGPDGNRNGRSYLIAPEVYNDIDNGKRVTTGATFLLGITNGSYLGHYRDVLSTLPRFMADYREDRVKNLHSRTPSNFVDRELAFISLNKKDNWFHYRYRTYDDMIEPLNNYHRRSVTLGNIDHLQGRVWINLTNWIRLSCDMGYSKTLWPAMALAEQETYELNLFTTARHSGMVFNELAGFQRIRTAGRSLEQSATLPLFLQVNQSLDRFWKATVRLEAAQREWEDSRPDGEMRKLYGSGNHYFAQRSALRWALNWSGEWREDDHYQSIFNSGLRGQALSLGLNVDNNPRSAAQARQGGGLFVRWVASRQETMDATSYAEIEAKYRIDDDLSTRTRWGFNQSLLYGDGTVESDDTEAIDTGGLTGMGGSISALPRQHGQVWRSGSRLYLDLAATRSLNQRLDAVYDLRISNGEATSQFDLTHALRYEPGRTWKLELRSGFSYGDYTDAGVTGNDDGGGRASSARLHNTTALRVHPSRALSGLLELNTQSSFGNGDQLTLNLRERCEYVFFTINGIVRKFAVLSEEVNWSRGSATGAETVESTSVELLGTLYPTRVTQVGVRLRHEINSQDDSVKYLGGGFAAMNYSKLQLGVDYSYGYAEGGKESPTEQRWEVKMKKIF